MPRHSIRTCSTLPYNTVVGGYLFIVGRPGLGQGVQDHLSFLFVFFGGLKCWVAALLCGVEDIHLLRTSIHSPPPTPYTYYVYSPYIYS